MFSRKRIEPANEDSKTEKVEQGTGSDLSFNFDDPIIKFSDKEKDWLSHKDLFRGTQVFGSTGSGKSSGVGKTYAESLLKSGYGGLVLTVKNDEYDNWKKYAEATNREEDLIRFSLDSEYCFNFLDYQFKKHQNKAGLVTNLLNLFISIVSLSDGKSEGDKEGRYWIDALEELLTHTIDLIIKAKGTISLKEIFNVISTTPNDAKEWSDKDWQKTSYCYELFEAVLEKLKKNEIDGSDRVDFEEVSKLYWEIDFPELDPRTKSIIKQMFRGMALKLMREQIGQKFSRGITDIKPEDTFEGKIIVLDIPYHTYTKVGRMAQIIFKFLWQLAVQERPINEETKPVFLWVDEAQYFVTDYDDIFQSTARSARVATVYLTQNLHAYEKFINNRSGVKYLLANFQTIIFHCNSDPETNKFASELFGKMVSQRSSMTMTENGESRSSSESIEYQIMPLEFQKLKEGGQENDFVTQAYIYLTGKTWSNGKNWLLQDFKQKGM